MTPDSVFRHHTPSEKDIRQQKIQTLPLSTKNRSTKALSTKDSKYNYNSSTRKSVQPSEPWMLCILCGQSPIKVGGICQACINAAATNTPAITPQILHPANPLMVSHDGKKMKRQEAIARATHLYSPAVGNSSTVIPLNQPQLSFGGGPFRAIMHAVAFNPSKNSYSHAFLCSSNSRLHSSNNRTSLQLLRDARVASFDPYPTSQASQAAAKQSKHLLICPNHQQIKVFYRPSIRQQR
ncbi:hypothetical protein KEM48_004248 [Puccinia striiformis f. sp. tritici PST-130]|nr:hypothetical protein KEM48_004248 [Puccinia striiformis f. sp. tritici PST-130]